MSDPAAQGEPNHRRPLDTEVRQERTQIVSVGIRHASNGRRRFAKPAQVVPQRPVAGGKCRYLVVPHAPVEGKPMHKANWRTIAGDLVNQPCPVDRGSRGLDGHARPLTRSQDRPRHPMRL